MRLNSFYVEVEVARTFEQEPADAAPDDARLAHPKTRILFEVPAFAFLMDYARPKLFDVVVAKDEGLQRWDRWIQHLEKIENEEGHDEVMLAAASSARQAMLDLKSRA